MNETGNTVIKCESDDVEPKPEVHWITHDIKSNFTLLQDDVKTKQEIYIHNASAYDNGWLKCSATSLAGKITKTMRFEVFCEYRHWNKFILQKIF